jgi:threonine dehydratase
MARRRWSALPGLANATGVAAIHLKDEGKRFGLGSFKALGGAYAILTLVLAQASQQLGRPVTAGNWRGRKCALSHPG